MGETEKDVMNPEQELMMEWFFKDKLKETALAYLGSGVRNLKIELMNPKVVMGMSKKYQEPMVQLCVMNSQSIERTYEVRNYADAFCADICDPCELINTYVRAVKRTTIEKAEQSIKMLGDF